jgi:hypothetical protein
MAKAINPKFQENLNLYLMGCLEIYNKDFADRGYGEFQRQVLEVKVGRKYAKVMSVHKDGGQGSVHSFVNMENGDVLKPAGCNKPAKHARGNVYDKAHGVATMTPYGPAYLR